MHKHLYLIELFLGLCFIVDDNDFALGLLDVGVLKLARDPTLMVGILVGAQAAAALIVLDIVDDFIFVQA